MEDKNLNFLPEDDLEDMSQELDEPDNETPDSCNEDMLSDEVESDKREDTDTEKTKGKLLTVVEYVEIFAFALLFVLLIFSFAFRLCVVDGSSMNNTLQNQEKVLTTNLFYSPECGDIVVFYENKIHEKPLVKRVIATEGQTVEINFNTGKVYVDGEAIDEDYVYLNTGKYEYGIIYQNPNFDKDTKIYKVTVPEDCVFVMGDNRNGSDDSRNPSIGFISEQQIMGKVIFRISPFTRFN